jgi:hypothetical protein
MVLRDTLRDLPWWLNRLAEAAVGQARMTDNSRRGTHGNELDEFTGADGADQLAKALQNKRFRDRMLAAGRVNARASRLHEHARNEITTWVRYLCEAHGLQPWPPQRTVPLGFIGPLLPGWRRINHDANPSVTYLVRWLGRQSHTIADDEAAKEIHDTMIVLTDRIRRVINRAVPHKFCGPCPTLLTAEERAQLVADGEEDREECHIRLYAPPKADHVTCPRCGLEYDVKELQAWCWDVSGDKSFTLVQLCHIVLPTLGHVMSHRTLQRVVRRNEIAPSGYRAHVPTYELAQIRDALRR